MPPLNYKPDNR